MEVKQRISDGALERAAESWRNDDSPRGRVVLAIIDDLRDARAVCPTFDSAPEQPGGEGK